MLFSNLNWLFSDTFMKPFTFLNAYKFYSCSDSSRRKQIAFPIKANDLLENGVKVGFLSQFYDTAAVEMSLLGNSHLLTRIILQNNNYRIE